MKIIERKWYWIIQSDAGETMWFCHTEKQVKKRYKEMNYGSI